ncbi:MULTISPECIES: helix-turn-helix transcriptional regulator [Micromonospora]|uniref:XRE family transcriptional regulator n=1 Tax=Micromonospora solifontis TaxID=2487138 RepID=A0ABX9W939_9ACTN|nr:MULTISPECIES: helix-turn-helix transcriptional regulator [Micromonospora]NES17293.1 helix-turn-helix domain-containing protein [Micromonospora sp. PPF5-17B]NES39665.1 helix-turn-helix domain-containing protein [Micromonospora solifontis]NES59125.1 helix-turn-helix domain-containing protein [Micromonospora sp. PPF5-6]RNL87702.1 XRE family transcriptional regulator [Micromonospora solifontis]
MGQRPAELTPQASGRHFLGAELRCWRQQRGLSLARLAARVYLSPDLLGRMEKAERTASLDAMIRCDEVLETGGALARLWRFVNHQTATLPARSASATTPTRIRVTTEIVAVGSVDLGPALHETNRGGARLYVLPGGRER